MVASNHQQHSPSLLAVSTILLITLMPLSTSSFQYLSVIPSKNKNYPIMLTRRSRTQVHAKDLDEDYDYDAKVEHAAISFSTMQKGEHYNEINRRKALGLKLCSIFTIASSPLANPTAAAAVPNPLNLKGSYWETGALYKKSDVELPSDPEELISSLTQIADAMESLSDVASEGKFGDLSRMLRGGVVSESKLRLNAYALIDMIVEDDDNSEYKASEQFRRFLRDLEVLDAIVDSAAKKAKIDGGVVETIGRAVVSPLSAANEVARISAAEPAFSGADTRIDVLAALGTTTKALKAFIKIAKDAIQAQQ